MQLRDFVDYHTPALHRYEARHYVLLANIGRSAGESAPTLRRWSLGVPGQCAVQTPGYPIVLGELTRALCRALADDTGDLDYPGVVGPDQTAQWFAERAFERGVAFLDPIPQQIHALRDPPRYPGARGHARAVAPNDAALFTDWMMAFASEVLPHDPPPTRERLDHFMAEGSHQFWVVDGEPVSLAGVGGRMHNAAAIAHVYTPPALRGHGYAGSVTASVVESIFAEGKTTACLYTDLRNPYSNRCYQKIGFKPLCLSLHYPKAS